MTSTTEQRTDRLAALRHSAYRIRRNALDMGEVQGQGYIGQALGVADVLAVVYMDQLRYRAEDPHWEGRDRLLLSIGHYAIALYAALAEAGKGKPSKEATAPTGSPGPKISRITSRPDGAMRKIFTRPLTTK